MLCGLLNHGGNLWVIGVLVNYELTFELRVNLWIMSGELMNYEWWTFDGFTFHYQRPIFARIAKFCPAHWLTTGDLRMRTTNKNEWILANLGKNKRKRICPMFARFWAKNGQKRAKNGRTKPNPGETGRNRKFRRILIRDRHSLVDNASSFFLLLKYATITTVNTATVTTVTLTGTTTVTYYCHYYYCHYYYHQYCC